MERNKSGKVFLPVGLWEEKVQYEDYSDCIILADNLPLPEEVEDFSRVPVPSPFQFRTPPLPIHPPPPDIPQLVFSDSTVPKQPSQENENCFCYNCGVAIDGSRQCFVCAVKLCGSNFCKEARVAMEDCPVSICSKVKCQQSATSTLKVSGVTTGYSSKSTLDKYLETPENGICMYYIINSCMY